MSLNYTLKVVKMVNFMLCIFCHNTSNHTKYDICYNNDITQLNDRFYSIRCVPYVPGTRIYVEHS